MRICVLASTYDEQGSPIATANSTPFDPTPWLPDHDVDLVQLRKSDVPSKIRECAELGYDVFINLCDGVWFEEIAGVEVVVELERLGVPFTGPTPTLYALTKEQMKRAAVELGVPTPRYDFVRSEDDIERVARALRFPLIVKHFDGCSSIGMTRSSRVEDVEELRQQAGVMIERIGAALVEEFVEGSEYTVLVAENPNRPEDPLVFPPVFCAFPPGETFKHFDLKWHDFEEMKWGPCADAALAERLMDATRRIFVGLGGVSYARCDFRVDAAGNAWFLEINTTCGIFYPPGLEGGADMILLHDSRGHRGFLEHIIECARIRSKAKAHVSFAAALTL